jgi:Ser/Thr protein kinase RdoA (MazF antagonist)
MNSRAEPGGDVVKMLRDYDVGTLIEAMPLPGGSAQVLRVRTDRGAFVLKRAYDAAEIELQARVAAYLNHRGIRQARVIPTSAGAVVSADGNFLQEFLAGALVLQPTQQQTLAAMRHIGAYHRRLADLPGSFTPGSESLWQRVTDPAYLVRELPGLLARYEPGRLDEPVVAQALDILELARASLADLRRQVVHGDIGPDNVLMDGSEVVSIIDFTPYHESALFASCTALYWYHVHGRSSVDVGQLRASVDAIGGEREWTEQELALVPAGLLREALRRLATPLALAAQAGTKTPGPSVAPRHTALVSVVRALEAL